MKWKTNILEGLAKAKSCPLWNDQSLARLIKKKKERTHIAANIKNEKGDISYPADIKKMTLETLCHRFENSYEIDKFPRKIKLIKVNTKIIRKLE